MIEHCYEKLMVVKGANKTKEIQTALDSGWEIVGSDRPR